MKFLTQGTYNTVKLTATGQTYTVGTEEMILMDTYITAGSTDKSFSWVRIMGYINSSASAIPVEVWIVKLDADASAPDFDSADEVEQLQREGRIFFHKMYYLPARATQAPPQIKAEFKQVHLRAEEELRFFVLPYGTTGADVNETFRLEWREVSI